MKNRKNIIVLIICVLLISITLAAVINITLSYRGNLKVDTVKVSNVESTILATGSIASQNEATLHFQTGGKLTYLSVKEGDKVYQGQTIASLDTYALQKQLTATLNNYRIQRDTFDQTNANNANGVSAGAQRYGLEVTNKVNISGQPEIDIVNAMIKRIADQNQASLDNSVINVELANYALELSSITAPFNGLIVHEDVKSANVNVTPLTSFLIIDPNSLVFKAQVQEQDIDYINIGNKATISLNDGKNYTGYVSKIYPEKTTLSNGENVYQVEISSPDLKGVRYAQEGSVKIASNVAKNTKLVPYWTVLNHEKIWVRENGRDILKKVNVGRSHGNYIEITAGLNNSDKIIENPQSIVSNKYTIL